MAWCGCYRQHCEDTYDYGDGPDWPDVEEHVCAAGWFFRWDGPTVFIGGHPWDCLDGVPWGHRGFVEEWLQFVIQPLPWTT